MKKFLILIFSVFIMLSASINAFAYDFNGSLFFLNMDDGFYCSTQSSTSYTFTSQGEETFSINIKKNTDKFCPADFSKKDLENHKSNVSLYDEEALAELGVTLETDVIYCRKTLLESGSTAIETLMKTTIRDDEREETYYQKIYEFGGVDNIFTFAYTALSEDGADDFDHVFSSIKINEKQLNGLAENLKTYAVAAAMALIIVIGIIRFLRTPEKRKQGKL